MTPPSKYELAMWLVVVRALMAECGPMARLQTAEAWLTQKISEASDE